MLAFSTTMYGRTLCKELFTSNLVSSENNRAESFAKALVREKFEQHRSWIGVLNIEDNIYPTRRDNVELKTVRTSTLRRMNE